MHTKLTKLRVSAMILLLALNVLRAQPPIPNDPEFNKQWALRAIGAANAWATTTGSSNIVVAMFVSGINYDHEDLAANVWRNPGEIAGNGIDDDHNGYVDDIHGIDVVDHDSDPAEEEGTLLGTTAAGVIGAVGNNGKGVVGLNWSIQLMAVRIIGTDNLSTDARVLEALNYVLLMKQRGINIRVLTFGVTGSSPVPSHREVLGALGELGVLVTATAVPERDHDRTPGYPADYLLNNLICVAGVDEAGKLAVFSGWGRTSIHLAAPSVSIRTTGEAGPGLDYVDGSVSGRTWLASAHVSGAAALLASAWPGATAAQIKAALLSSVDLLPALTNKVVSNGRLNVGRAMEHLGAIMATTPPPPKLIVMRMDANVVLSWPANSSSFVLERTFSLPARSEDWTPVAGPVETQGESNTITLQRVDRAFFRLRRP